MLAPFRVRGFRFQWAGDLAMSWAVEMEVLILGWFVLVESGSVSLLAVFGALHYIGSLISPIFGVAGDRIGYAKLFWMTRAFYALLAGILLLLAWQDALTPVAVLVVALLAGIVRPSDMVMRYAVVAMILPPQQLIGGLGIARITSDSARIAGALAGASTVAAFGMVWAYVVIVGLYCMSFILTRQILSEDVNRIVRDKADHHQQL
ncbi:MAG: MFS transporter, partial [Betaproteobacteria bacterium]|nr:MFS transporter [Betaproteobacteria bacterium]